MAYETIERRGKAGTESPAELLHTERDTMTAEQAIAWLSLKPKDLPVFVLLGTDPLAPDAIRHWSREAIRSEVKSEKIWNAFAVIDAMTKWPEKHLPG